MNQLILNRETFELPADGWYQIAPIGEFPHEAAEVVQVVDAAACEAIVAAFRAEASAPNFAGLLIDFDHFSLDGKQKSEAAGWIVELEFRGSRDEGGNLKAEVAYNAGEIHREDAKDAEAYNAGGRDQRSQLQGAGLWAKIRWSDLGDECVRGGRYRFISPVWARSDCEDLGNGRLRPVAAVPPMSGPVRNARRCGMRVLWYGRREWTVCDTGCLRAHQRSTA